MLQEKIKKLFLFLLLNSIPLFVSGQNVTSMSQQKDLSVAERNQLTAHSTTLSINGDVNGDRVLDVADVTTLVSIILDKTTSASVGDVDCDGNIDVADVTALVRICLEHSAKLNYVTIVGNEAYIISKYNADYDIVISFAKTMKNELYSIKRVYLAANTGEKLSADHTRAVAVLLSQQESSDMIGPMTVKTAGAPYGFSWIGGNHLYLDQNSGVKSATTNTFAIYADGKQLTAGSTYAEVVTIKAENVIFDPNIAPAAGADILSSPLIEESITFSVDRGEITVGVEHRYLKETVVGTYYGMQSMFTSGTHFITAEGGFSDWKANAAINIIKADAPQLNCFSQKNTNGYYQNTVLLPYGLGKHEYVGERDKIFVWAGYKTYHVLIQNKTIPAGTQLFWKGVYNWNAPIADDDNNYIYSYRVDGVEQTMKIVKKP